MPLRGPLTLRMHHMSDMPQGKLLSITAHSLVM